LIKEITDSFSIAWGVVEILTVEFLISLGVAQNLTVNFSMLKECGRKFDCQFLNA